jgi:hypothetical protein
MAHRCVDLLNVPSESKSPLNLSALCWLSVYNADLGYHQVLYADQILALLLLSWAHTPSTSAGPPPVPIPAGADHTPLPGSRCQLIAGSPLAFLGSYSPTATITNAPNGTSQAERLLHPLQSSC